MEKLKEFKTYKVKVRTCNAFRNYFKSDGYDKEYYDCENGLIYVITNEPSEIFARFGALVLESVEAVGIGYEL